MRDEDEKKSLTESIQGALNRTVFFRAGTFGALGSHCSMLQNVHRTLTSSSSSADGDVVVGHAQTTDDEKCI